MTVTLINPRPAFVERIRLQQLVTGSDDATVDYPNVLGEAVRLVVDTVGRYWRGRTQRDVGDAARGSATTT